MFGQLYINDERVGDAKLQFSFGHAGEIRLQIRGLERNRDYTLTEGDVYVQGPRLGVRGFVAIDESSARSQRRPVMMTFELLPARRSLVGTAKRLALRLVDRIRWTPSTDRPATAVANSGAACSIPRSLRTGTAAR